MSNTGGPASDPINTPIAVFRVVHDSILQMNPGEIVYVSVCVRVHECEIVLWTALKGFVERLCASGDL